MMTSINATLSAGGSTSSGLLRRVRAHDPDAWRRLVQIYGPVVYRWCARSGLNPDDAADVGQEVFLAVASGISAFQRDRKGGTFTGWLRNITRNKIADLYRNRPIHFSAGGSDVQTLLSQLPDAFAQDEQDLDDDGRKSEGIPAVVFQRALQLIQSEFEETTWRVFWATAVEDRPVKEVAAEMQMSEMAVRKAKSRVLRRLRDEFDGELLN